MFPQRLVSFATITGLTIALVYAAKITPVPATTSDTLRIVRGKYLVAINPPTPLTDSDRKAIHVYRMTLPSANNKVLALTTLHAPTTSITPRKEIQ